MAKYLLRPSPKPSDFKDIYRIYVPRELYVSLQANSRDLWYLKDGGSGEPVAFGKLSYAQDDVKNKVLQVSQEFKDLFGLNFSDSYMLKRCDANPTEIASEVILQEHKQEQKRPDNVPLSPTQKRDWEVWILAALLDKIVSPRLLINIEFRGETRSFRVSSVCLSSTGGTLHSPIDFCVPRSQSEIRIECQDEDSTTSNFTLDRNGIFGMDQQLDTLDKMLLFHGPLNNYSVPLTKTSLLLIGPYGSGKRLLGERIAKLPWRKHTIITIEHLGTSPAKTLTQVFSDSLRNQPALITIEDFEDLQKSSGRRFESALSKAFTTIKNAKVLVLVKVGSVTMSEELSNCFRTRIDMPSLDQDSRRQLITHALKAYEVGMSIPAQLPAIVAEVTPGYTGLELQNLVEEAASNTRIYDMTRVNRDSASPNVLSGVAKDVPQTGMELEITLENFEQAMNANSLSGLAKARSTSRRVVRWSDIGGQEETKKTVEMHFEWPLKYPEKFKALNLQPKKGMLLYGPPGCSKTMTALALATEAKLNFIPIKGPELLTKYLGDSESKLRDIFQRARTVAPCIIFFDEIDSINSGGESGGGVKLVETLLNELDGVDSNNNVFVLAATNKPWDLDKALLRPGRFDTLLYVRLPDASARKKIFRIQMSSLLQDTLQVDLDPLVEATEGCSGAEIVDFCSNAKLVALEEQIDLPSVLLTSQHFDKALSSLRKDTSIQTVAGYEAFENSLRG